MKNATKLKLSALVGLVLSPAFGGCDEQIEEVLLDDAEAVSFRSLIDDKKSQFTLEQIMVEWKVRQDVWLKDNPNAAEGGGGCEMTYTPTGHPSGSYWMKGYCCDDLDDRDTCTYEYKAFCIPGHSCIHIQ